MLSHAVIAGNINQSLMVLRNCIEILRENQKQAANKVSVFLCFHLSKDFSDTLVMSICVTIWYTGTLYEY